MIARRERYDRHLLDAWIDARSGAQEDSAEAAMERFLQTKPDWLR
jgi:hypothetical protein